MTALLDWKETENCEEQELIFGRKLQKMVEEEYKNCTYEQDFSIQSIDGLHRIIINKRAIDFDYREELCAIYENGGEKAAELYFNKIKEQLR